MIRFYSLFVTTDELTTSPFIHEFSSAHDITLRRGEPEMINFLLQYRIPRSQQDELCIVYEPELLQLTKVEVELFDNQTLITVNLIPQEVGSMRIGFTFPHATEMRAATRALLAPIQKNQNVDVLSLM